MNEFVLDLSCIGGVMVCDLDSSAVYRGVEPQSGQNKGYAIGICCFSLGT